jgi:hypothetical protein
MRAFQSGAFALGLSNESKKAVQKHTGPKHIMWAGVSARYHGSYVGS